MENQYIKRINKEIERQRKIQQGLGLKSFHKSYQMRLVDSGTLYAKAMDKVLGHDRFSKTRKNIFNLEKLYHKSKSNYKSLVKKHKVLKGKIANIEEVIEAKKLLGRNSNLLEKEVGLYQEFMNEVVKNGKHTQLTQEYDKLRKREAERQKDLARSVRKELYLRTRKDKMLDAEKKEKATPDLTLVR